MRRFIEARQADSVLVRFARSRKDDDGTIIVVEPEVRRPVSNAEINRELAALKRVFSLAVQSGKLLQRPHIPMLKENNVRTGFFERDQFEAVRRHLPDWFAPVITFGYVTGWRIQSEVLPLLWRHVDFNAGQVRLDAGTTKNGEGRVFPMTAELRDCLEQQELAMKALRLRNMICANVFHRDAKPIRVFRKEWRKACLAAGCPGRIAHDFRRTAVRNLVRAGVPERVAMTMTGHKTRSVFERYNIVSKGDLKEAAKRLDIASPFTPSTSNSSTSATR